MWPSWPTAGFVTGHQQSARRRVRRISRAAPRSRRRAANGGPRLSRDPGARARPPRIRPAWPTRRGGGGQDAGLLPLGHALDQQLGAGRGSGGRAIGRMSWSRLGRAAGYDLSWLRSAPDGDPLRPRDRHRLRPLRSGLPAHPPGDRQQSRAVHLQGHRHLHRRARRGGGDRSRPRPARPPGRHPGGHRRRADRRHPDHPPPPRPLPPGPPAGRAHRRDGLWLRRKAARQEDEVPHRGRLRPTSRPTSPFAAAGGSPGAGWTLEAIPTPGHTSNHLCYALHEENALLHRRPHHGLVDHRHHPAGRRHERLSGQPRAGEGAGIRHPVADARPADPGGRALHRRLHRPSARPSGPDPDPALGGPAHDRRHGPPGLQGHRQTPVARRGALDARARSSPWCGTAGWRTTASRAWRACTGCCDFRASAGEERIKASSG